MKTDVIWIAITSFFSGVLICFLIVVSAHRNYHEVIKTSIGEFIIHDGKIFSVYEMERNTRGEIQAGAR